MASGFTLGFGGSHLGPLGGLLGYSGSTLGDFIREAQLDDFLYSWGGPQRITSSRELPGRTHWDPQPVVSVGPRGDPPAGVLAGVIASAGGAVPGVVFGRDPDFVNTGQPPLIFDRVPVLLPGQTDPGREERETSEEEGEMAHTWTHLAQQGLGILFGEPALPSAFQPGGMGFAPQVPTGGGGTGKVTVDTATGKVTPCRRRRRKPLLTQADLAVLFQIGTLPNNANVRTSLSRAVRR